jgi:hypothetical protein
LKRIKNNLLIFADREPYESATELIDAPTAFLEIVSPAEKAGTGETAAAAKIKTLMRSVIEVDFDDPEALLKPENWGLSGYKIAFLPTENPVSNDAGKSR